jgi:predicted outer membrane protein
MHRRASGPPDHIVPHTAPHRRSRLAFLRLLLLVATTAVLAASTTALLLPTRTGAPDAPVAAEPAATAAAAVADSRDHRSDAGASRKDRDTSTGTTAAAAASPTAAAADPEKAAADGPVGPADREALAKVKQAGLWEMPVGMMATQRAVTPRLREVGAKIATEHKELDRLVTAAAKQLDVELPDQPTAEQQGWIREIEAQANGPEFDKRAVFLLRQAHGKVLPVLAQVRAGTRNAVVRQLTTDAMGFVQRHIEYLESTGLVDFEQLPQPALATAAAPQPEAPTPWWADAVAGAVVVLLAALFAALIVLAVRALAGSMRRPAQSSR